MAKPLQTPDHHNHACSLKTPFIFFYNNHNYSGEAFLKISGDFAPSAKRVLVRYRCQRSRPGLKPGFQLISTVFSENEVRVVYKPLKFSTSTLANYVFTDYLVHRYTAMSKQVQAFVAKVWGLPTLQYGWRAGHTLLSIEDGHSNQTGITWK